MLFPCSYLRFVFANGTERSFFVHCLTAFNDLYGTRICTRNATRQVGDMTGATIPLSLQEKVCRFKVKFSCVVLKFHFCSNVCEYVMVIVLCTYIASVPVCTVYTLYSEMWTFITSKIFQGAHDQYCI